MQTKSANKISNPLTMWGFRLQLRNPQQLSLTTQMCYYLLVDSTKMFWIPQVRLRIPQNRPIF